MTFVSPMEPEESIQRDKPWPYYAQLEALIEHKIRTNVWKPHERIPSESELESTYQVSRTVVRQALSNLVKKGLLRREKGRGTFVSEPKIGGGLFQRLASFHEEMSLQGLQVTTRVLEKKLVTADSGEGPVAELFPGELLLKLSRLRFVDGEPHVISTSYLRHKLCPNLVDEDLSDKSLYGLLEHKYGLVVAHGVRAIEVAAASKVEADLLQIKRGSPLVLVESVTYLPDGTTLEWSRAKHRGDRTRFEVRLLRSVPEDCLTLRTKPGA
ncbi:MAG: GntR family transcriptional regulator [Bacillota bacterium]